MHGHSARTFSPAPGQPQKQWGQEAEREPLLMSRGESERKMARDLGLSRMAQGSSQRRVAQEEGPPALRAWGPRVPN